MEEEYLYQTSDILGSSPTPTLPAELAAAVGALFGVYMVFTAIILVLSIVALWKIFTKAGVPGWKSIVPIYNAYILLKIVGRPGWWLLLLLFVPVVNIIIAIIVSLDLAKSFGKSTTFAVVGLILFSMIGYLMLAFGDAKYVGPAGAAGADPINPPAEPTPVQPEQTESASTDSDKTSAA